MPLRLVPSAMLRASLCTMTTSEKASLSSLRSVFLPCHGTKPLSEIGMLLLSRYLANQVYGTTKVYLLSRKSCPLDSVGIGVGR